MEDTKKKNTDQKKATATTYKTHWHSFWFGAMSALSVILFLLLLGVVTDTFSFNEINPKAVSVTKTKTAPAENISNMSFDDVLANMEINKDEFDTCMDGDRSKAIVEENFDSGVIAGVEGTPHSFVFIGDAIYEIPGAHEEAGMREFFDDLLAGNELRATDISGDRTIKPVDENDWIRGEDDARITVIEYSDVDCPFCKTFHQSTQNMMSDYANDVRWVFRHMPSDGLHPDARTKAEASECIGELGGAGAFWQYIDGIFEQQL